MCNVLNVTFSYDANETAFRRTVTPDYLFFDVQWTPGMPISAFRTATSIRLLD